MEKHPDDLSEVRVMLSELATEQKHMLTAQKDHEARLRKLEYFVISAIGAGGLYKFLIAG